MNTSQNPSPATFVTLTPEQRASHNAKRDAWFETLLAQAHDDSDPETQANARLLLKNRGVIA